MIKKNHTHAKSSTANRNETKWQILLKLRAGKLRRNIELDLNKCKTTIISHIRHMRDKGLICVENYKPTQKGYSISPAEFEKLVYLGGGRGTTSLSTGSEFGFLRYHYVSFSVDILERPKEINQSFRTINLINNVFYCKSYNMGSVKFHKHKAVLTLFEVYGGDVEECGLKSIEILEELKQEVSKDGFKLDSLYKCNNQHIADALNPLATFIGERFGACVLVKGDDDGGNILTIDFSKGVAEIETENKYTCLEDMNKVQYFYKRLMAMTPQQQEQTIFRKW